MRDYILLYINGVRIEVRGPSAFLMLSDFLRYELRKTGTKVVCAEGDCGACTVLKSSPLNSTKNLNFISLNACIMPVVLLDCCHIITVEGLREDGALNSLQKCMTQHQGAQCGFCTPGFMMALTGLFEQKKDVTEKNVKNALTGNLCRCTGYYPIVQAALAVNTKELTTIKDRYSEKAVTLDLMTTMKKPVHIKSEDKEFFSPTKIKDAAKYKSKNKETRIFSSATDLGVPMNKGKLDPRVYLGLHLVSDLYKIKKTGSRLFVGARVTLTELENAVAPLVPEFESFLRIFASPQIKNVATLVGNVANGSPIGDTLPFMSVANATVHLQGKTKVRKVAFSDFYLGYRKINIKNDEVISGIEFDIPNRNEVMRLYKVSQRKDLDISCVNAGFRLRMDKKRIVTEAHIAYGGVGPTVIKMKSAEKYLKGKVLDAPTVDQTVEILAKEMTPRSDVRGTGEFRSKLSQNLFRKFIQEIGAQNE